MIIIKNQIILRKGIELLIRQAHVRKSEVKFKFASFALNRFRGNKMLDNLYWILTGYKKINKKRKKRKPANKMKGRCHLSLKFL
jgi:hypothetical protein